MADEVFSTGNCTKLMPGHSNREPKSASPAPFTPRRELYWELARGDLKEKLR